MTDPIAETIARVRELDTHPHTWKAPWVARTFEIDCPCPNGDHCGDPHDCAEVEAPEEYPEGPCVVQISVPGLETFARPTAELIAFYRTAAPALADECERLRAEAERLSTRRESAADVAKRLGFTVTDEQKAANLRRNLGDAAPVYLAAELKRSELIEAECERLRERVARLEEALRWRPLTSDPASWPEDGVLVLWRWWHPGDMSSGTRRGRHVYGCGETETGLRVSDAAAWLPLPAPPPKGESK